MLLLAVHPVFICGMLYEKSSWNEKYAKIVFIEMNSRNKLHTDSVICYGRR